jgi:hypothetical protein
MRARASEAATCGGAEYIHEGYFLGDSQLAFRTKYWPHRNDHVLERGHGSTNESVFHWG